MSRSKQRRLAKLRGGLPDATDHLYDYKMAVRALVGAAKTSYVALGLDGLPWTGNMPNDQLAMWAQRVHRRRSHLSPTTALG